MGGEEGAFDFSPAGRRFAFMATGHIVGHASVMCAPQWTQEEVARYPPSPATGVTATAVSQGNL